MNVILIMSDSFRRDNLSCYNPHSGVKTPNLDHLVSESYVFDRFYCNSFPTVPNRFDMFTGTHCFVKQDWGPLPVNEIVLSQILGESGYNTALIADTPHIIQHGFNYERGFSHYIWNRGQENDRFQSFPETVEFPCSIDKLRSPAENLVPHLRNTAFYNYEEEFFAPQTMIQACRWLEKNYDRGDFFLWIDTFDPHEPWDPPDYYVDMYDPGYVGERIIYPKYHPIDCFSEQEVNHCRAMYYGEVTMVDRWIGRVLEQVDYLGLASNTAIIFTSDHGFLFGEHGFMGKSFVADGYFECLRLYEEIIHIPLIIRMPGQKQQKRIPGMASATDLMPSILEMTNVVDTTKTSGTAAVQSLQCGFINAEPWTLDLSSLHGESILPLMKGEKKSIHDFLVCSFPLIHGTPRIDKSVITTEEWSLHVLSAVRDSDQEMSPPKDLPYRNNRGDYKPGEKKAALFHSASDPKQEKDVLLDHTDVAEELHARYVESLKEWGLSNDRFELNKRLIM